MPYVGDADKYISNPRNCHLLQRIYNNSTWEYGTVCIFFMVFPENEVEYEKVIKFSFIAFLKNGVESGIVGKFSFIAYPDNRVECGIVGKFFFIAFPDNLVECKIVGKFSFIVFLTTVWNVEWLASFLS